MPKRRFRDLGTSCSSSKDSSSSSSNRSYRYDVFISFRGSDTRNTFVDHLYAHLTRKGIFTFKDDPQLNKGDSISTQLLRAIQQSRVSIILFSKDYAASTWCLDEMATIAECHINFKQTIFPVFYDVAPSDVRKQKGVYQNAFALLTAGHHPHKVDCWKRAMTCLAGSSGWDVRNKPEFEEIEKIVQEVINSLGHKFSGFVDDLIRIQPRVEALERLLKLRSADDGFRVLGIRGMGGIGKTTLVTVLYDRISYQFHACCFIENVSKIYRDGGCVAVQKQILRQTIRENNLEAYSPSEISRIIRNRLHNIKLLVVLDDIDQIEQLKELHINPKLLCRGSRIVITTRDEHILKEYGANVVYEAQLMTDSEALDLLHRKAFKSDNSNSTFSELIPQVLKYAQCLPLAIRVMGSFLCTRNAIQWRATLDGLRSNPLDKRIMKVLHLSFEGLGPREREIFLHIACFFIGEKEDYLSRILDACGLHPDIGIPLIAEKSLITIRNKEIHMHGMLQQLGKQIVQGQHSNEPEFWSRLWLYRDFHRVMMTEMKAPIEIKAIVLDQKEDGFEFNKMRAEDLSKFGHLKLLILSHKNFSGKPAVLSNSLCYLSWNGYPFNSLPSNFQLHDLVKLNMPDSDIEQLWEGIQRLPCLKRMDLSNSKNLTTTPSFEGIQNLERIDFTGCINLLQVHPSIGLLTELVFLSLQNCTILSSLDFGSVSRLWSLRVLRLSGCLGLGKTPDFAGASNLEYLDMDRCKSLSKIHESIGALTKLRFLSFRNCTSLCRIPDIFDNMTSLTTLNLCGCRDFTTLPLPRTIGSPSPLESLIFLDLSFCRISVVPDSIGELKGLERLNLQGNNFTTLPSTFKRLSSLAYLNLSHCHRLESLPKLPTKSGQSDSVGRYFKTTSGSRDHRSGLYVYDCPKMTKRLFSCEDPGIPFKWLKRLFKEPRHFRCGFDIVLPLHRKYIDLDGNPSIPEWFDHKFEEGSIIRINNSNMHVDWAGFAFCVAFHLDNRPAVSGSSHHLHSSPLSYPFCLSFESEHTEECFNMPLSLERNKVASSIYIWTIYISREHCHFVKTGARITFKAGKGLIVKKWGFRVLTKKGLKRTPKTQLPLPFVENVDERSIRLEPKIQLPYNWLVCDEDEVENDEAKGKEINLFNLGLLTGRLH